MQLKVVKADGSIEHYLHTKIIGTVNNALATSGEPNIAVAEHLAEAITYFLYNGKHRRRTTTSEIFSMVQVTLAATSYEDAAEALGEYHYRRLLKRRRIEVIDDDQVQDHTAGARRGGPPSRWNKSQIVNDLIVRQKLDRQVARAIASMVEEKILNIGLARVSRGLIKQLVRADTAATLQAEQQLRTASAETDEKDSADTEICFRQQREGLCTVEL